MSGFMMALGGALQGYGSATLDEMKAEALAKREEALSQAKFERERLLAADTRQFESAEKQKQRDFDTAENDKQRSFTAGENDKTRADTNDYRTKSLDIQNQELELKKKTSGSVLQTADGPVYQTGDKAVPIIDDKGDRVKTLLTDKDKPANVATMEFLIQKGVAKNYDDAWRQVKQGVKVDTSPAEVEKMTETATKNEFDGSYVKPSAEEYQAARDRNRARIEKNLGLTKSPSPKAAGNVPAVGEEQDGFRFKGGDPSDQSNWEQVK